MKARLQMEGRRLAVETTPVKPTLSQTEREKDLTSPQHCYALPLAPISVALLSRTSSHILRGTVLFPYL